ncbi:MAG: hypothetical protein ACON5A_05665 [Candidatus Comchoanobacterales bacterium]
MAKHNITFFSAENNIIQKVDSSVEYDKSLWDQVIAVRKVEQSNLRLIYETITDTENNNMPPEQIEFMEDLFDEIEKKSKGKTTFIQKKIINLINNNIKVHEKIHNRYDNEFNGDKKVSFDDILGWYEKLPEKDTRDKFYTEVFADIFSSIFKVLENILYFEYHAKNDDPSTLSNKIATAIFLYEVTHAIIISTFIIPISKILGSTHELAIMAVLDILMLLKLAIVLSFRTLDTIIYLSTLGQVNPQTAEKIEKALSDFEHASQKHQDLRGGNIFYDARIKVWNHAFNTMVNTLLNNDTRIIKTKTQEKTDSKNKNRGKASLYFQKRNILMLQRLCENNKDTPWYEAELNLSGSGCLKLAFEEPVIVKDKRNKRHLGKYDIYIDEVYNTINIAIHSFIDNSETAQNNIQRKTNDKQIESTQAQQEDENSGQRKTNDNHVKPDDKNNGFFNSLYYIFCSQEKQKNSEKSVNVTKKPAPKHEETDVELLTNSIRESLKTIYDKHTFKDKPSINIALMTKAENTTLKAAMEEITRSSKFGQYYEVYHSKNNNTMRHYWQNNFGKFSKMFEYELDENLVKNKEQKNSQQDKTNSNTEESQINNTLKHINKTLKQRQVCLLQSENMIDKLNQKAFIDNKNISIIPPRPKTLRSRR